MEHIEQIEPTFLVVDDTEDNLDLLEFALKHKPVKMLRASSGKECLQIAAQKNPDVILLDIQMPEMDGFETLKQLRANPLTEKIPVIFLTAQKKDVSSIEAGLEMGAEGYLTKPIDIEELFVRAKILVRVKRAEAELERTKADFMAMIVHDLRSPLSGIKNTFEFFRELYQIKKPITKEHLQLFESAGEASNRMLLLVNDILDLSKLQAGSMKVEKHSNSFGIVAHVVCREMEIQFRQKGIALEKKYADDLPPVLIDVDKIGQVMLNLLSNALKFTPTGGTVTIAANYNEAKNLLYASVTDTGIGIHAEEIPLLFEMYKQASSAKKVKQKGTGLGLSICKMIIEAHGGTMWVESEPGKYTTFYFTLPVEPHGA